MSGNSITVGDSSQSPARPSSDSNVPFENMTLDQLATVIETLKDLQGNDISTEDLATRILPRFKTLQEAADTIAAYRGQKRPRADDDDPVTTKRKILDLKFDEVEILTQSFTVRRWGQ